MPILIQGIKLSKIAMDLESESENGGVTAEYCLMSTGGKVLAKQSIGGYGGMKIQPGTESQILLNKFVESYKADIQKVLGLDTK